MASPPPRRSTDRPVVLRGGAIVAAPFTLAGATAAAIAVATGLWMAYGEHRVGPAAWAMLLGAGGTGLAAFLAARGCRVVVGDGAVHDLVAWRTVRRTAVADIAAIRVRRGPWRLFEMELGDSSRHVVWGTGPQQFPAAQMAGARERDLAAIDTMMGIAGRL